MKSSYDSNNKVFNDILTKYNVNSKNVTYANTNLCEVEQ